MNVINNKMTRINRRDKQITLNSGEIVPYDILVLTPGLQYRVVVPKAQHGAPRNVIAVNDTYDAALLLEWAAETREARDCHVIVCG